MSEQNIQAEVMMQDAAEGNLVFRNNTGALKDSTGRLVRYGLCVGSSDIIEVVPIVITQEMVGKTVGVFCAEEVKTKHGKVTQMQTNFMEAVRKKGGIAGVVRCPEDAVKLRSDFIESLNRSR